MDEIDITKNDIAQSTSSANYILIPSIASMESKINFCSAKEYDSARSSTILKLGLLDLLIAEFFIDEKPRKLVMDAATSEGKMR